MLYYVLCHIITTMTHSEAVNRQPDQHSQVFAVLQYCFIRMLLMRA